jgi:AcrR family transcriptional regulator
VTATVGLRERKKRETRRAIGEAAHAMFLERGFEHVTVADIARAADVSEGTVFNYFPTKEDLFYSGLEAFEEQLIEAVRLRPAGESVVAAFREFLLARSDGIPERAPIIVEAARVIGASPTLQAREREIVAGYADELAALLAAENGAASDDVEPHVVANALMGAQAAVSRQVRASALAGKAGRPLAVFARSQTERVFDRLERGLGGYAIKRGSA